MTTQIVRIDRPAEYPQHKPNAPEEVIPILQIKHPPHLCINIGERVESVLRGAGWDTNQHEHAKDKA